MKYPTKTSYAWVREIKTESFWMLLLALFSVYVCANCLFADIYYFARVLKTENNLDYFYFSFVTALTIGYGDFYPETPFGKIIVIAHACFTAIYFAFMVAVLSVKMFYPKNTIYFSQKIIFDPIEKRFAVRMINSHRERLVNPEIRVFFTEHCFGNVMGPMHFLTKFDAMPYLGKHDFTLYFHDDIGSISVSSEWYKALQHGRNDHSLAKSRFRITISVSGSYGIQQIAYYKKYYPSDLDIGTGFKPIQYNDEDQRKNGNIRYTKFHNFWNDFNHILRHE